MATTNEIVNRIGRRLRRGVAASTTLFADIVDELNNAKDELEEGVTLPWFLEAQETVDNTANDSNIGVSDLTGTLIRPFDDEPLTYIDPTGASAEDIPLPQESEFAILKQKYPGSGEVPKEFTFVGTGYVLRPIPTQAITYRVRFYQKDPTAFADGATNLWSTFFPSLVRDMAGEIVARSLRDAAAETYFTAQKGISYGRYIRAIEARAAAGQRYVMGD